ncbi:protein turtle homolog B-like [Haliotis rubra]|uniref:protein turtle homolog B-like n=1 Tax=Haliotis rubra TaxID=36100 RepID=UPI001EE52717|nr:protein turtle homolog B-like [Haliotis rubra]
MRDGSLTITDVRGDDQGGYSCRIEKQNSASEWSETIQVMVLADPAPYVSAPVQATPGKTVTLTCSFAARNLSWTTQVAYSWTRNNIPIEGGQRYQMRDGSLTITDVRENDQGGYSCRTEKQNSSSEWSETIQVMVLADPSLTTAVVAGAAAAVIAVVAVIFVVFLFLYKRTKRSLEARYITPVSVRMSDIDKSAIDDTDVYTLIED